jgi:hypothetical protein
MDEFITVEVAGERSWPVPADAIARDRADHLARQATGAGPEVGNDLYDSVFSSEYAFAVGNEELLTSWVTQHMDRAALLAFKPPAS